MPSDLAPSILAPPPVPSMPAGEFAHVREDTPEPEEHDADEVRFRLPSKSPWSSSG